VFTKHFNLCFILEGWIVCFEAGSLASLLILLPQPPECWDKASTTLPGPDILNSCKIRANVILKTRSTEDSKALIILDPTEKNLQEHS
jgi:hypothetical protein